MSEKPDELPRSFGAYSLLKLLARGGMGEIYLARTEGITGFEKYYAVKKLLKKFTHDNDVGGRFVDEAKLGARLQHPNIVQVYDLGRVSEELYMATEFVDGFDLRRVLRFCHEKKKRIPLDIALFIVRELLSGLAYAHRQVDGEGHSISLIHRDISPQNALVSFEGEVKIIDFGLAKSTQRSQETQANVLLGNFGYMSPEQARGQVLDIRTDIYSCGIVLFELVTGTKRFVEENPLKLLEMVARPTPIMPSDRVPTVPRALDKIYATATNFDKEGRYPTAEAFRDDVTAALHRLNPRASRENLAQFLSHLFLGGHAPPTVDNDVLNKSVVLLARDLHQGMDAFSASSAADDLKNRSLGQGYAEDAPQTSSLALLRSARVGDVLSHAAITGEFSASPSDPATLLAEAGPAVMDLSLEVPLTSSESDLRSAVDSLRLAAGTSAGHGVPAATKMYDSPSWPQVLGQANALSSQQKSTRTQEAQWDVQRQLEQQVAALQVQEQLDNQMATQMQAQLDAQVQSQLEQKMQGRQADLQEQVRQEAAARQLEVQRQATMKAQAAEEQEQQITAQRQAEHRARQHELAEQVAVAPPAPDMVSPGLLIPPPAGQRAQARTPQGLVADNATEPSVPQAKPPGLPAAAAAAAASPFFASVQKRSPPAAEPSIVISDELEAAVPEQKLTMRNPRAPSDTSTQDGFGNGGANDSLIIEFDSQSGGSEEGIPVIEGTPSPIRPAARPLGKGPPALPNPAMARRVSEEGPPSTMPLPPRRR